MEKNATNESNTSDGNNKNKNPGNKIAYAAIVGVVVFWLLILGLSKGVPEYKKWSASKVIEAQRLSIEEDLRNFSIKKGDILPVPRAGNFVELKGGPDTRIRCSLREMEKHLDDKVSIIGDMGEEENSFLVEYKIGENDPIEERIFKSDEECGNGGLYIVTREDIYWAKEGYRELSRRAAERAAKKYEIQSAAEREAEKIKKLLEEAGLLN